MRSIAQWLSLLLVVGGVFALLYRRRPGLRRRLRLAVWVALLGYAVLFVARIMWRPPDEEQLIRLAAAVGALGLIWAALWLYAHRRRGRSL